VGMRFLLPGANDLPSYWQKHHARGRTQYASARGSLAAADFFDPSVRGLTGLFQMGALSRGCCFDPTCLRHPARRLRSIDPVQLLALHVASKALEDAGF